MKTKEITVELKLLAQPKQYHSLTVTVSSTRSFDEWEAPKQPDEEEAEIKALRNNLSKALTEGIYEEIKKLYGEPAARAALVAYFGQGGQV